jgi:hypothetical protein
MDIVVARYNEDIKWTTMLKGDFNLIVYDKGQGHMTPGQSHLTLGHPLQNVGREAHTYLHHIVSNWDNLAEYTLFLQGWPFDHLVKLVDIQKFIDGKSVPRDGASQIGNAEYLYCDVMGNPDYPNKPIGEYFKKILKIDPPETIFFTIHGAQYAVHKSLMLNKGLEFWKDLLKMSETIEDFPWIIERLWMYIFLTKLS